MKPLTRSFRLLRDDVSKYVSFTLKDGPDAAPLPDWLYDDPTVPQRYRQDIAAVQLARMFGWTLDYARRVVKDPFEYAVVSGVVDGINKANEQRK